MIVSKCPPWRISFFCPMINLLAFALICCHVQQKDKLCLHYPSPSLHFQNNGFYVLQAAWIRPNCKVLHLLSIYGLTHKVALLFRLTHWFDLFVYVLLKNCIWINIHKDNNILISHIHHTAAKKDFHFHALLSPQDSWVLPGQAQSSRLIKLIHEPK